ncbi:MAG TPA: class I SAM-dependent methyltransferase [Candidatus Elarobacter sp.]|jgi:SAM-dependent methyltransferase|nr:class I SAM-dependent methyltransferase [Candidatus Elarobacter sp.]
MEPSERPENLAADPIGGRRPTSHERRAGQPWDESYQPGPAPWDIGGPQPIVERLVSERRFAGAVLDAGCGLGENALLVASLGLHVVGVDVAPTALAIARAKAADRGMDVEFVEADAFELTRLGRTFDTVLDCGLFHTFDAGERPEYVASLAAVTKRGATLYVLCFREDGSNAAPHPVGREELEAVFDAGAGWDIVSLEPDRLMTRFHGDAGAPAWCTTIKRL